MDNERYNTKASNLMFFRLFGGHPWAYYTENLFTNNYPFKNGYRYVNHDSFSPATALQKCTSMKLKVYRVNCYDTYTGRYTYNDVGAAGDDYYGQWFEEKTVNPLLDGESNVKGTAWDWIKLVGTPTVTVNNSEIEASFDEEEK